jgi:nitroreductase
MKELDFIYKRHSVRKFKDQPIPQEHLEEIIKAAIAAPSGKNLQNWHFVILTDQNKIKEIAGIVAKKNAALAEYLIDADKIKAHQASARYHTAFKDAPVLVLVYAGPYLSVAEMLLEAGVMPQEKANEYKRVSPGIQNISAAMENLLLAAANLGYGGCWMTGPTYAADEISAYIEFDKIVGKKDYFLAALTPLGVAADEKAVSPGRKPLAEILTII